MEASGLKSLSIKGEKGTFLLAYGPNADTEAAEFFKNIPNTNISDKANINK